ncbi:MAG: DUF72 domain-containing protein [Firmicutes bacterium]|nr:DUF72 domain-containing protein [Bacillota bacterium]
MARGMILVGTSGFSYEDWRGVFYPPDLGTREMLGYYSQHFPVVELDFTYYRMPSPRTMAQIERKTGPGFTFCVKAYREMTHERPDDAGELRSLCRQFASALEPMSEAGKLGCVLVQFPWSFGPGPANLQFVQSLPELLPDLPLVVEFRNNGWISDDTRRVLREAGLGFCAVDEPRLKGLMPPLAWVTSPVSYVRFHGRNARKWWKHEHAWERYDYLYSEEELKSWVPRIREMADQAERTYVLFNNCHAGQAAKNASMMQLLLSADLPACGA